ncbi:MAG TPA: DNA repair protein RadA [Blastocatellia bacterium]|nr:DNA repair protein RadA [Blastocatellia bacterium]
MANKAPRTVYACQNCGHQSRKWLGRCPDCGEWNSFVEERERTLGKDATAISRGGLRLNENKPVPFGEIEAQADAREVTGIEEFDRVLGGGIVPGSLVLIGGAPGIGKSTLLISVADKLSQVYGHVLYVSGEESERQIKLRGERLGLQPENLFLLAETNLERIFDEINRLQPKAIVVDSVQTVYSEKIESAPGSVSQVRDAAGQFLLLAKNLTVPVFLIGHITKEGMIAGPKALEHIVDTVLYFEGERYHNHRILRAAKNRFGAANEIGIFEMTGQGLIGVPNPSELFLNERPIGVAGSAVIAAMEGTRPLLVEIQALVSQSKYGTGRRTTQGVEINRVALIVAMLEKRVGFHLSSDDIFVNLVGGMTLDEPATDLGIVAAVASSFRNIPINEHTIVFGEVGLAGEVRATSQAAVRVREAARMGFRRIVMPQNNVSGLEPDDRVEIIGVRSVVEALDALF